MFFIFKKLREKNGFTQQELAKKVGVNQNTVSLWENGKCFPRKDMLIVLSDLFGCTIDELVKGEDNATK